MNNYFIILAAGKGKRFNSKIPKQHILYKNKPLFMHSVNTAIKSKLFKKIILVLDKTSAFKKNKNIDVIKGGNERHLSSKKALYHIKNNKVKNVFIHDAARPNFSINLLKSLKKELKKNKAVVPYTSTDNSTKYKYDNKIINLQREKILFTQTPQCFDFKTLLNLTNKNNKLVTDEAALFLNNNKKIKFIKGDEKNIKITKRSDLNKFSKKTLYGIGFDIHKLIKKKNFI